MKTRAEVEALKENWRRDPCYDLTPPPEGFEAYAEELAAFQEKCDTGWTTASNRRLDDACKRLGIPGNHDLLIHLTLMENRIETLEREVEKLTEIVYRLEGK